MIRLKSIPRVWLASLMIILLTAGIAGCGQQVEKDKEAEPQAAAEPVTLQISAAASLTDVMADIEKLYQEEHANIKFTFNLASSGNLQQQIEQGAPADVFISAAQDKMDALEEKDLIVKDSRQDLLKNRMVLIVAKDNDTIKGFDDINNVGVMAIGEPESVPAGKYAQESLTNMALWDKVQSKVVYAKDVRQVMAYVESGDADAGMVYQTDAKISNKVKVVALAEENTHSSLVYPAAVIKDSKNQEAARDFVDFLSSDEARAVFEQYGFSTIKP